MLVLLAQIAPPAPDQEPFAWIAALLATACAALFWQLLIRMDRQTEDWKTNARTATAELSKTVDALRAVTDAVDRHGRDTASAIEGNRQALLTLSGDVRKLTDTMSVVDRRLERLEGDRSPPGGTR